MNSPNKDDYHYSFKIAILGYTGVGKTSILLAQQLLEEDDGHLYSERSSQNDCCINFKVSVYEEENIKFRVQYWDAPGEERFMKLSSRFCAGASGVLLVFDVTNRSSFERLGDWIYENHEMLQRPIVLVGNKIDLPNHQVTFEEALSFSKRYNMPYMTTSCYDSSVVTKPFDYLLNEIEEKLPKQLDPTALYNTGIRIGRRLRTKKFALWDESIMPDVTEKVDWL